MIQLTKYQTAKTQILFILFGSFLFVVPAILNGFPFIFTDTLSYITSGINLVSPFDRPIFYGLLVRVINAFINLWGVVIFQAGLIAFLLQQLSSILFPRLAIAYLYLWLILTAFLTSVTWFAGQISPDIFTAILFLAIIILALTYQNASIVKITSLSVLMTISVCVHSSNLLIGLIFSSSIIFWFIFQKVSWRVWIKFLVPVFISFLIAVSLIIASNIRSNYGATLNPVGKVFMLARILEDGPGLKYLRERCKLIELKTCASLPILEQARLIELQDPESKSPELRNLVASSFLWGGGLVVSGGVFSVNEEAGSIIQGSIRTYPIEEFWALVRNMGNQFITFEVGEQFNSTLKMGAINELIETYFSELYSSYLNSMQSLGELVFIVQFLNPIYFCVVIFSVISIPCIYLFFWRRNIPLEKISLTIFSLFIFLSANALISGGLSGVFDRYQSRVIWLLPTISILLLLGSLKNLSRVNANK
jgi:hypothetical protein